MGRQCAHAASRVEQLEAVLGSGGPRVVWVDRRLDRVDERAIRQRLRGHDVDRALRAVVCAVRDDWEAFCSVDPDLRVLFEAERKDRDRSKNE